MTESRSALEPEPGLLEEARTGSVDALERLLAGIRGPVRRIALAVTGRPDDAEDVAQEVLIRVARRVQELRRPSAFPAWVHRITRNAALDSARADTRRRRRSEPLEAADEVGAGPGSDPSGGSGSLDRIRDRRARTLVEAFVKELPSRQRQVFDLVELQGYGPTEVAEVLDLAPGSVRASLFKARRALRSRMLEDHPELEEEFG